MSLERLPMVGLDMEAEQSISQFVIPAGAGATYAASNNIATITFNAAHGLTLSPAANVPPNYFITFGGSTSGQTGTGVLVGNIFRILSIPSTTSITIYCTITALTVTSLTGIPVFFPEMQIGGASAFVNGPVQGISTVGTYGPQIPKGCTINCSLGANCAVRYNPDNTALILDAQSTAALPGGTTPASAPTWRDLIAASGSGQATLLPPGMGIWANGTTATSRFSQIQ